MKKYINASAEQLLNNKSLLIILCIEFVVMISCFSVCFGSLELYNIRRQMFEKNNMKSFYYVRSEDNSQINSYIENNIGLDVMSFGYAEGVNVDTDIMLYSKSAIENIKMLTSKGEVIDINKDYGNKIPCLITSELAKSYDVGKSYELKTNDDITIGNFYICGVIKNDVVFSPNYGFDYDKSCIIAYDPKELIKKDTGYMEFYAINTEGLKDFENTYSSYISEKVFQPFDYYYKTRNILERDYIMPYLMLAITFMALSIAGLFSYNVVSLEYLKRQMGIYYLCGAKLHQIMLIFVLKTIMIVTIPSLIAIPVVLIMKNSEMAQTILISWNGYFAAVCLCVLGLLISSFVSLIKINRRQIIKAIKSV